MGTNLSDFFNTDCMSQFLCIDMNVRVAIRTLATDMLLSCSGPSMCPDRRLRRAMLLEGSKQMASKVSDLLVLTTSPCVDTGDVGCLGLLFFMPFCGCGTTFHMLMLGCASDRVRACDQASLVMTCFAGEPYLVTASRQHVLNVVHQKLSRELVVGIADFRWRSATTSRHQGLWRRFANNDRDVV